MVLFRTIIQVESHVVKKNSKSAFFHKASGKAWVTRNPKAIKAENDLIKTLEIERVRQLHGETIRGDIQVTLIFTFDNYFTGKMRRNKMLPDLDNLFCLPLDALTKAGVYEDDNQVVSLDGSRRRPGEKNLLEIIITDGTGL